MWEDPGVRGLVLLAGGVHEIAFDIEHFHATASRAWCPVVLQEAGFVGEADGNIMFAPSITE
jgi:hypothetical protein